MKNNLILHAERELDIIGFADDDKMNGQMRKHILHMVDEFSKEGHSGFSANYAVSLLTKLLKFEPISVLTGEDDEWIDHGNGLFQNIRCSHVFKENGKSKDINGLVFYDIVKDESGEERKCYFTNSKSAVEITFPYIPKCEYRENIITDENDIQK